MDPIINILGGGISYKGTFLPNKLIGNLEGNFGLVWDGDSCESISGKTGYYQRYNNPHKLSLYLAAGLPVIIHEDAALASFIIDNGIGIAIKSLSGLEEQLKNIDIDAYLAMCNEVLRISKKIRKGYFLRSCFEKINEDIHRKIKLGL